MGINSNWNYRVSFTLFFALAVIFWMLSGNAYEELKKQPQVTTFQNVENLRVQDYGLMIRSEAQAMKPLPFSLWSQFDNQRLESPNTGRSKNISWIAVKGDTRLVLPVFETLHEEDSDGCLIDKRTAQKLFSNTNAIDGTVKLNGKEYIVRGVIDGPAQTIITQLAIESDLTLSNISVSGTQNTDTFLMRHNLPGTLTVTSDNYVLMAKFLYSLPMIAALLTGLLLLNLAGMQWKHYPIRQMVVSVGMFALGTAVFLLVFGMIPEKLIPSQWADFEFWSTSGRDWLQSAIDYLASAKYRPDLIRLSRVLKSAMGILSAGFIFGLYYLYRIYSANWQLMMMQYSQTGKLQSANGQQLSAINEVNEIEKLTDSIGL